MSRSTHVPQSFRSSSVNLSAPVPASCVSGMEWKGMEGKGEGFSSGLWSLVVDHSKHHHQSVTREPMMSGEAI